MDEEDADDPVPLDEAAPVEGSWSFYRARGLVIMGVYSDICIQIFAETNEAMETDDAELRELPKKKLTLSFEEYKNLTNSIIIYLRNEEEKQVAAGELIK